MLWSKLLIGLLSASGVAAVSTDGLYSLVKRRLPNHVDDFRFNVVPNITGSDEGYDQFTVKSAPNGTIIVQGTSISALSSGLHRYLTDVAHVDIYWFIGSRLDQAPAKLPHLHKPINGSSTVPWRYHFNTVTFSYTTAFWSWEEWETQLDWMALRGINLPLAWVGAEKIMVEVFQEIGLTDAEIATFLSGPAFQAWNRFGNIQGSWGGDLPYAWIDQQFALQKKIVHRMVELGMTPVLPAFTGFVPNNITRVYPNASVVRSADWNGFSTRYSNDSFLEPFDEHYAPMQTSFIRKQQDAYGNVTSIYTLDQYNEMNPYSGDLDYLKNVTHTTWKSLKDVDPDAIWLMQGWLFYSASEFWTDKRVEAYLSGVDQNDDMLILDLFSESEPQWRRTDSYYGKPWIWCQLHDYGGNQGLYGQIRNITQNASQALIESPSMVGYGLSPEGQEGNEIVYDLLLDQAWSKSPIDTRKYFHSWVSSRYAGSGSIPQELYDAWETLRTTVYDNTDLTDVTAVVKSIFELEPSVDGLVNVTGTHGTKITYDPSLVVKAWQSMYQATSSNSKLWDNPAYQHDMVDVTRQVMANAFIPLYNNLISSWNSSNSDPKNQTLTQEGQKMIHLLADLDSVLSTHENFRLSTWISSARAWARGNKTQAAYLEYNARNQITLWGPRGEITDYASKQWGGLLSSYYIPRWKIFVEYLQSTSVSAYSETALEDKLRKFELGWQNQNSSDSDSQDSSDLKHVLTRVQHRWSSTFHAV
ncbi:hypothetical protein N7478_001923 [Penicillium angulare]|uniref:uncharacterized protein n=1 Tax=Penicillium angulare TaxID=116970 RepID=UPI0025415AFC|nr:uncharacterized protein N7478_001923 [Penicillium angulare]KAJ5288893.1 hypothetical protein N7478_001923 [Penicillium angulare]